MSIDLTLDRIRNLFSQFERYTRPTVHIAGTNGKGSVAALLACFFSGAGHSVGRFNSPHLITPSDCIAINSKPIAEDLYNSIKTEVEAKNSEGGFKASDFEVLVVTAFIAFERAKVDFVVCEVGLGGRLDATNVLPDEVIIASVITSIALDHTAFLGSTPEAIAREKAGIIRKDGLVILAKQAFPEAAATVQEVAASLGARCVHAPVAEPRPWDEIFDGPPQEQFSLSPFSPPPPLPVTVRFSDQDMDKYKLTLPLHGDHQLENLGTALAVIHALVYEPDGARKRAVTDLLGQLNVIKLRAAARECRWPGRLSFHRGVFTSPSNGEAKELTVLADGAHNEAAAETLASYISDLFTSLSRERGVKTATLTYILGLSHSPPKTPESVLKPLFKLAKRVGDGGLQFKVRAAFVEFSPPEGMPWVKPVPPETLRKALDAILEAESIGPVDRYVATEEKKVDELERALRSTSTGSGGLNVQKEGESNLHELKRALNWAGEAQVEEDNHLVVIAGSLYLVADFYRLMNKSGSQ